MFRFWIVNIFPLVMMRLKVRPCRFQDGNLSDLAIWFWMAKMVIFSSGNVKLLSSSLISTISYAYVCSVELCSVEISKPQGK